VSTPMDEVVLQAGGLRVEVTLRPFSLVIRRAGRSLLRSGGAWAVDGEIRDQFLQFTEGVLAWSCRPRTGRAQREVALPRGEWIETWSGRHVRGGGEVIVDAPLERILVWVRAGSIVVTYAAQHVAAGLGDGGGRAESERPLQATLWGEPRLGHTAARLADGSRIGWRSGEWELPEGRDVAVATR
jgi:hypothetical protein